MLLKSDDTQSHKSNMNSCRLYFIIDFYDMQFSIYPQFSGTKFCNK